MSAAEGQAFADFVKELTQITQKLGPFDPGQSRRALSIVENVVTSPRIRWLLGMDRQLTQRENVFHEKLDEDKYRELLRSVVEAEYQKAQLLDALSDGPLSVRQMAAATGLPVYTVSLRLGELEKSGKADLHSYEGSTPRFLRVAA